MGEKAIRAAVAADRGESGSRCQEPVKTWEEGEEPFCWQNDRTEGEVSENSWDSSFGVSAEVLGKLETGCVGGMDLWVQWE